MDNQEILNAGGSESLEVQLSGQEASPQPRLVVKKTSNTKKFLKQNWELYLMLIPGMLSLFVFSYGPMFGLYLAFVDYTNPSVSFLQSTFVGWAQFERMFAFGLWKYVKNTLILSTMKLIITFPAPIVLALLINEVRNVLFKRVFQTISYMPHFISWIMISGMMVILLETQDGLVNKVIEAFGGTRISWYQEPGKWRGILVIATLWKGIGWGTITYLAVLTSIDPQLYEAATVDGAGRLRQTWHITLPGLAGIVSIHMILAVGSIFGDDVDQVIALVGDNSLLWPTVDLLGTRIYRFALGGNFTYYPMSTAMGLLQGIISLILVMSANYAAKKLGQSTVW